MNITYKKIITLRIKRLEQILKQIEKELKKITNERMIRKLTIEYDITEEIKTELENIIESKNNEYLLERITNIKHASG
jgi:predicted  nucleic acid-binding Zn-ribbon protein